MNRFALSVTIAALAFTTAGAAQAADLLIDTPRAPDIYSGPSSSGAWDGFYLGVFGGYGAGVVNDVDSDYSFTDDEFSIGGWDLGVTTGALFTVTDGVVAGVAGDIAWSNFADDEGSFDYSVDWNGSLRGVLGFDAGMIMPYVTGGLAFANATADDGSYEDTQTHMGWTVGVGAQVAMTDDLSLDVQYRYSDYGSKDYALSSTTELDLNASTFTVGLNWKF